MITTLRTHAKNKDFITLVKQLDEGLAITDGDEHDFYDQFNKIDSIKYVIIAYKNNEPVGCGAIKSYATKTMEIKRMFTTHASRGKGIATKILTELEQWAAELGSETCILETGIRQLEAIALYKKNGYKRIPNYGQYTAIKSSVCFEKLVINKTKS